MIIKVKSKEDLKGIKIGSILLKDLREDSNLSDLKVNDKESYSRYQVYNITGSGMVQLAIPIDEIPEIPILINGMRVSGIADNPPVLNKTAEELYTEGIWWLQH